VCVCACTCACVYDSGESCTGTPRRELRLLYYSLPTWVSCNFPNAFLKFIVIIRYYNRFFSLSLFDVTLLFINAFVVVYIHIYMYTKRTVYPKTERNFVKKTYKRLKFIAASTPCGRLTEGETRWKRHRGDTKIKPRARTTLTGRPGSAQRRFRFQITFAGRERNVRRQTSLPVSFARREPFPNGTPRTGRAVNRPP